ncbi:uncharacterized protein YxjI [Paenibacillus shirakamiensis]|uniref:Uncharacterized protein YxjI n=1 Tax=Paenibacillus shirakamiensis TaxID=1265935 RepID=A0ABS4JGA6_9BACL|nr:hypothetical protein [Paenibacillus shirakamiensis]MBP2000748.1 uncharacterized protein YxjI [Paenibacillus shirakamiensis]
MELYFRDNFFNAGRTEIMNEAGQPAGSVDLRSTFGSALDIYDYTGSIVCSGKLRFMANRWDLTAPSGSPLGTVRERLSFLSKRYEYDAGEGRGVYEITCPLFSKEYSIVSMTGDVVARFIQTSRWLESGAYCLQNGSQLLDEYVLVGVVMGVHTMQKNTQGSF